MNSEHSNGKAILSLRPEHVRVWTSEDDTANETNAFPCTVVECFFIAGTYHVELITQTSQPQKLRAKSEKPLSAGLKVYCNLTHGSFIPSV